MDDKRRIIEYIMKNKDIEIPKMQSELKITYREARHVVDYMLRLGGLVYSDKLTFSCVPVYKVIEEKIRREQEEDRREEEEWRRLKNKMAERNNEYSKEKLDVLLKKLNKVKEDIKNFYESEDYKSLYNNDGNDEDDDDEDDDDDDDDDD